MTPHDYFALLPLLLVVGFALVILLLETFCSSRKTLIFSSTLIGLVVVLYASFIAPASTNPLLTPWIQFDAFARFFERFFTSIAIITALIAAPFFHRFQTTRGEFYFFLYSSLFGLVLISASSDYLTLFLGIETLSIALYVLCGYVKSWKLASEAAFKYFLLGSVATSFFLFGVALLYGATGTTQFVAQDNLLYYAGIALVTLSLLFKAAVVPFHIWAPDVYAGAPSPVTAFMAVATKAGAFAALIRIFMLELPNFDPLWHKVVGYLVYPTLLFANLVAIRQLQLRRFFAYSGISHAGFLLIPLASGTQEAAPAMLFYLVVYALATLGAFAVLSFMDDTSDGVTRSDLQGLFYKSPLLAGIFTLSLLTLAGIPPSIGFFAKFYLLKVAFSAGNYGLVYMGLFVTIFSAYYYLRFIAALFSNTPEAGKTPSKSTASFTASVACFSLILFCSFYPEPILQIVSAVCKV